MPDTEIKCEGCEKVIPEDEIINQDSLGTVLCQSCFEQGETGLCERCQFYRIEICKKGYRTWNDSVPVPRYQCKGYWPRGQTTLEKYLELER